MTRFERRLHGWEASLAIHSGAAAADFASPTSGLYDAQDKQLRESAVAWQVLNDKILLVVEPAYHAARPAGRRWWELRVDLGNTEIKARYLTRRVPRSAGRCSSRRPGRCSGGSTRRRSAD